MRYIIGQDLSGNTGKNEVIAERIMQSNNFWKHSLDNIIRHCFHTNKQF